MLTEMKTKAVPAQRRRHESQSQHKGDEDDKDDTTNKTNHKETQQRRHPLTHRRRLSFELGGSLGPVGYAVLAVSTPRSEELHQPHMSSEFCMKRSKLLSVSSITSLGSPLFLSFVFYGLTHTIHWVYTHEM